MIPPHREGPRAEEPRERRSSVPPQLHPSTVERPRVGVRERAPDEARRKLSIVRAEASLPYLPPLAVVVALGAVLWNAGDRYALPRFQDDAYFYLEIARNIATTGKSEFAPGILTNGYQPLWMLVLVAAGSVFGFTGTVLKALEFTSLGAAFIGFVWLFGVRGVLPSIFYTALLWFVAASFALNGMETSLLVPGLVVFVCAFFSRAPIVDRHRALVLWLAALFCLATRIDAALVLLPMLAVAPISRRAKLFSFTGLAVCGLAYCCANQLIFDAWLPVSGLAKSLGGLQLNEAYLSQLGRSLEPSRLSDKHSPLIPYASMIATLALAIALRHRRSFPNRALPVTVAASLGLLLYAGKLAFLSSWVVWPWYGYPTAVFVLLAVWILATTYHSDQSRNRIAMGVAGVALAAYQLTPHLQTWEEGFPAHNRSFIAANADKLDDEIIAMGDRSGSFGFDYGGGVFQLEGLVNDASYLPVLERGGDLRPHLCQVGIDTVVSYEDGPTDYTSRRIPVLQPRVTSYPGPYIEVHRSEELARSPEPARFDPPTTFLYAWKLRCP